VFIILFLRHAALKYSLCWLYAPNCFKFLSTVARFSLYRVEMATIGDMPKVTQIGPTGRRFGAARRNTSRGFCLLLRGISGRYMYARGRSRYARSVGGFARRDKKCHTLRKT